MDLKQMRAFMALYEEGQVTRAALRLGVVQPALSMQIRRIEDQHGVALFLRSSQGLTPTPFAAELYRLCCESAAIVDRVDGFLAAARGRGGELSIGAPPSLAHSVLGEILAAFHAQTPDLRIRVHEGYSAHLHDWLISEALDFAVLTGSGEDERVASQPLLREDLVLVAAIGTAPAALDRITARELAGLPLVLPTKRHTLRAMIDAELANVGHAVAPALEIDSLAIVLSLLEQGRWFSVLPAVTVSAGWAAERLRAVPIVEPRLSRELVVAHKASRPLGEPALAFIACLRVALERRAVAQPADQD